MKGKIITLEMRFWRGMLKNTRTDTIRNNTIRTRVGITPVLNYAKKQQLG